MTDINDFGKNVLLSKFVTIILSVFSALGNGYRLLLAWIVIFKATFTFFRHLLGREREANRWLSLKPSGYTLFIVWNQHKLCLFLWEKDLLTKRVWNDHLILRKSWNKRLSVCELAAPFDPFFFHYLDNLCEFENICVLPKDLNAKEDSVLTLH